jgi:hypothetical protein
MDGNGLQRCLNDGCIVKNKSSVFSFLVNQQGGKFIYGKKLRYTTYKKI